MAKSQIISMDFIMAFVLYMVALSIFFFAFQDSIKAASFKVQPQLIFSKLSNMENSFLQRSKLVSLDSYMISYDPVKLHETLKEVSSANYCIYVQNRSEVIRNFAAYEMENNIYFDSTKCGQEKFGKFDSTAHCQGKDALLASKPVVYGKDIMMLNVLVCSR